MSSIITPPHSSPDVDPLSTEDQRILSLFFKKYSKMLASEARKKWPQMSFYDREDAVSAFILKMATKNKGYLEEWLQPEKIRTVIFAFKNHQISIYRTERTRATTDFDCDDVIAAQSEMDPALQKIETMEQIELIKSYVKRYCTERDYLIFNMAFIYAKEYSRRDIGYVFGISERVVNQRIYLIRNKLAKAGFLKLISC